MFSYSCMLEYCNEFLGETVHFEVRTAHATCDYTFKRRPLMSFWENVKYLRGSFFL